MQSIHSNVIADKEKQFDMRGMFEQLSEKVDLLEGRDKIIMTMYLEQKISMTEIAKLVGITAGNMTRRIKRIARRLILAEACFKNRHLFTPKELEIISEYLLRGSSLKETAENCCCTYYLARKASKKVKIIKDEIFKEYF
jgi:transposase-like protein